MCFGDFYIPFVLEYLIYDIVNHPFHYLNELVDCLKEKNILLGISNYFVLLLLSSVYNVCTPQQ